VEKMGDIFSPVLTLEQHLPNASELASGGDAKPRSRRNTSTKRQAATKTGQGKNRARKDSVSSSRLEETKQAG